MRTRQTTGTSKRCAEEMMRDAALDAAQHLGPTKMTEARNYLYQLLASALTQDQMTAIECLIDIGFNGGKAAGRLGFG